MGPNADPPLRPKSTWPERAFAEEIERNKQQHEERMQELRREQARKRAEALHILGLDEEKLATLQQLVERAPELLELLDQGPEDV